MATTERELLVAIARGSDAAARELWARHAPRLLAFLRALLPAGGPVDADDVLQQTFCRILETSVSNLRRVDDVPAWLFSVARNIAFNHGRGSARERVRVRTRAVAGAAGDRQCGRADESDGVSPARDERLWAALGQLMPDVRDVVLLKHVAGLTFDQIAIATQTNRNTAAGRYRAAMSLLEKELAGAARAAPAGPAALSLAPHHVEVTHG